MEKNKNNHQEIPEETKREEGQSIVLIALVMIGLIGFVGLAVDVGFVFVRGSELSKSVDAAVLAGVVEVIDISDLQLANERAEQFFETNLPISATQSTSPITPLGTAINYTSSAVEDALGQIEYTVTATWPVELFFLRVLNFDVVNLTRSATGAYFPVTDIYASRRVEEGALSTSNQSVFGPGICSGYGDPFSPLNPNWNGNNNEFDGLYSYRYRILVPSTYTSNEIRVELFDPDSINQAENTHTIFHTQPWLDDGRAPQQVLACAGGGNQRNACLIRTGETALGLPQDQINLWWFVRIDENRGTGAAPGNGNCGAPANYDPAYNTQTAFTLYYFAETNNGTLQRINLARYVGQTGQEADNHETDMRWVSPGGDVSYDQDVFVPADPSFGSAGSFQLDIDADLPGIVTDPNTGDFYLFLDVQAQTGASENGFEIWAGPPDYTDDIASDVNLRNVQIVNNPGSHSSRGATVFGMGNLPLNSNFDNEVSIPLIYVPPEYAGQTVFISLFDTDSGAQPPITFYFDSIAFDVQDWSGLPGQWRTDQSPVDWNVTDWAMTFGVDAQLDPDGLARNCQPGSCNNQWVTPAYRVTIPTYDPDQCPAGYNPATATQEERNVCTPFFGGRLTAFYRGGSGDTYGWQIRLAGLPFLTD